MQSKGQIKPVISKTTTNKQNTLPQTGENKSNLGIIGLGLLHWLVYLD
ncbi:LPXTG cell wall anchor domain-containing protein [Lactobacillus amylovorus]|nr:LPXTG cell wall anchor domain-containing protein [Lactobacillus amylovorus]UNL46940.1 LPXTG cell wall anchor domain-containing protein [Lactobacillus amylovorus]